MILSELRAILNLIKGYFQTTVSYVTPEMYGAGRGATDAEAFEEALKTGLPLHLKPNMTYNLGTAEIDLSDLVNVTIKGDHSVIKGGTIILNLNADWTRTAEGLDVNRVEQHFKIEGVRWNKLDQATPAVVTGSPLIVNDCQIVNHKIFAVIPNNLYIDRVSFTNTDAWVSTACLTDGGYLIYGATARGVYLPFTGRGDAWQFINCQSGPSMSSGPCITVNGANKSVTLINCVNMVVGYTNPSSYAPPPTINLISCHYENEIAPVVNMTTKPELKACVVYNSCAFQDLVTLDDPDAVFVGLSYMFAMPKTYRVGHPRKGIPPQVLRNFVGIVQSNGTISTRKTTNTVYGLPSSTAGMFTSQTVRTSDDTNVLDIVGEYQYGVVFSVDAEDFDVTNNYGTVYTIACTNQYIQWNMHPVFDDRKRYFMHFFRKDTTTNDIERCVIFMDNYIYKQVNGQGALFVDIGSDTINGIYPWLPYTQAGFSMDSLGTIAS